ncbi:MAG: bifunctional hydroxymethylpyrimidine kinase/phosphomethylpyrimidine kinase [Bryobacteraceae bacterium]
MQPVALTIAGSDPSGGAGLQADLKTFHQFGVYGEAVVTLVTVQNTQRADRVHCLPADLVLEQISAVVEDIRPQAAKTGALGDPAIVEAVGNAARGFDFPLVVDPVMSGKHGAELISGDGGRALETRLLPLAYLVTPNLAEAAALAGMEVSTVPHMREAARRIAALGPRAVLVKGGHLAGDAVDILYVDGGWHEFSAARFATPHTHGTGCTYSAAITAELAKGTPLLDAVARAKRFITEAIRTNPGLGGGNGPVNHHANMA